MRRVSGHHPDRRAGKPAGRPLEASGDVRSFADAQTRSKSGAVVDTDLITQAKRRGRKICIVTGELEGPCFGGGISTTNRGLAMVLSQLGHAVDVLYTRVRDRNPVCARGEFSDHVEEFQRLGIRLDCIEHAGELSDWPARSYLALQHLLGRRYDFVFFDDVGGAAYYPLLARRTGSPELRGTSMCVSAHGSTQLSADMNEVSPLKLGDLLLMEMERRSIELADVVRSSSAYVLDRYRSFGWKLPRNCSVFPDFVSGNWSAPRPLRRTPVKEIVFAGGLAPENALSLFCRALERLKYKLGDYQVTFLAPTSRERRVIIRYLAGWPFSVRVLDNFNHEQTLSYLKQEGRLAVVPSAEGHSLTLIAECIQQGMPFLASSGSGVDELLDEESRRINLFSPKVDALQSKLVEVLKEGAIPARAESTQAQRQRVFAKWLEELADDKQARPRIALASPPPPILVVIVPSSFPPDQCEVELRRTIDAYGGTVHIEALAERPEELRAWVRSASWSRSINVEHVNDFAKLALSIAEREEAIAVVCHVSQIPGPDWVERARTCFAAETGISALTGMVASEIEKTAEVAEIGAKKLHRTEIDRFLIGYAPPVFGLAQQTNSGFVLLQPGLLADLASVSPIDDEYRRLKRMEHWIHEVLVTLHMQGRRFELLPDLTIKRAVQETPFEVNRLAPFMRSLAETLYGAPRATDRWILARKAIDEGLAAEDARNNVEYARRLEAKTGNTVAPIGTNAPWPQQARQLAAIASAAGQIELAVDLAKAYAVPQGMMTSSNLAAYVQSEAKTIRLAQLVVAEKFRPVNPKENKHTFEKEKRALWVRAALHTEGQAGFEFPSLDLSGVDDFVCWVEPEREQVPVRVRIDLFALDRNDRFLSEKVVWAHEPIAWEFEIPAGLRTSCRVVLSCEVADRPGMPADRRADGRELAADRAADRSEIAADRSEMMADRAELADDSEIAPDCFVRFVDPRFVARRT